MLSQAVEILLVEDNPADVDLTREALRDWKLLNHLNVVGDGVEAMAYLRGEGKFAKAVRPDLILLDLNLPRKDGREMLAEIKADRYLKTIPIVVLSTSDADADVVKSYGLGANCYVIKPIGIDNFVKVVESIGDFWFTIVRLPSRDLLREYRNALQRGSAGAPSGSLARERIQILMVEDNPADSDFVREILSERARPSFGIESCRRLSDAFERLERGGFDVVLLDLGLPDSQGIDTYRRLAEAFPSVPIVIATGMEDSGSALEAIRAGAEDYVLKSELEGRLLSRVIQYAIERKWSDQERNTLLAREQVARAEAEKAILARDEFLGIASHELRTPITSLRMQSPLLARLAVSEAGKHLSEKERRLLLGFDAQTARLSGLVENLLDISQINAGKLRLEYGDVDLSVLVEDLLERFRDPIAAAGCRVDFQGDRGAIGKWDRFRIEQVATNLLTNALKYGSGKPIEIRVEKCAGCVRLKVRDHGIGIKKEDIARVFGRFERAVRPSELGGGFGLGLYIVRQIVDAHQGIVSVESEPGQGSEFTVELPVRGGAMAAA